MRRIGHIKTLHALACEDGQLVNDNVIDLFAEAAVLKCDATHRTTLNPGRIAFPKQCREIESANGIFERKASAPGKLE